MKLYVVPKFRHVLITFSKFQSILVHFRPPHGSISFMSSTFSSIYVISCQLKEVMQWLEVGDSLFSQLCTRPFNFNTNNSIILSYNYCEPKDVCVNCSSFRAWIHCLLFVMQKWLWYTLPLLILDDNHFTRKVCNKNGISYILDVTKWDGETLRW